MLSEDKYLVYRLSQSPGNAMSKLEGGIIFTCFQKKDGLPADAADLCQFVLGQTFAKAQFFYAVLHIISGRPRSAWDLPGARALPMIRFYRSNHLPQ